MATMKKASKAMAKPKLKKAQSGTTVGGTKGQGKLGPALGIGIPVAGMVAAGANMIKNAVKRRKERKATEEETRKALENAKSQRTKKSQVPAPFDKRKAEKAKRVVAKTGGTAKYKMGGAKKYQPGGFTDDREFQGPITKETNQQMDKRYPLSYGPRVYDYDVRDQVGNRRDDETASKRPEDYVFDRYYRKGGAAKATYKTGGMVNPNAKVSKQTKPGSKGVTPKVNPKATAAKRATGRVGGTSKAPRTAKPKNK